MSSSFHNSKTKKILEKILEDEFKGPWIHIRGSTRDIGWKLHVSIHPDDYEKAVKEFYPFLKKLDKNIGFKFAVKDLARDMTKHELQRGKTFVIYIPEDKENEIPNILNKIEEIIEKKKIRVYQPAPNDEIVGRIGAIGVTYTSFSDRPIEVPKEYISIYEGKYLKSHERRTNPALAVPFWKAKRFAELFGKYPSSYLLFMAKRAVNGSSLNTLSEAVKKHTLRKGSIKHFEKDTETLELKAGEIAILREGDECFIKEKGKHGFTTISTNRLLHGGWESSLSGLGYIIGKDGYVKLEEGGSVKLRKALKRELIFKTNHLESHHLIVEKVCLPSGERVVRIHNIGKKPVKLHRLRV